ncbi:MAG: hypothetical protein R3B54_12195 [Bdellovibrionota bacterium]
MKLNTYILSGAIALLIALLPTSLRATDFDSPECRAFCAEVEGTKGFIAQAKETKFFGELDTPEKEREAGTRYQQYNYVRTRYYELEAKLLFLAASDFLRTGSVSDKFADYSLEFLGTRKPTSDQFRAGIETASVPLTLALIRKSFYKIAMEECPISKSWQKMTAQEVKTSMILR